MAESPSPPPGIHVWGATLAFHDRLLFRALDLTLTAGSITALLGPSGVGKSTLLRLIAELVGPDVLDGRVSASDGAPLAGRITWMAQRDALLPWLRIDQNVALGARMRGETVDIDRARALLDLVGLANRASERPGVLSGGERQRVALARTLMEDRPVVLMDEPFSALDAITRHRLQELAARLLRGRTVLLVTHDPLEALRLADTVLVMTGRPATVSEPLSPPGPSPRAVGDPDLLALRDTLMDRLAA